MWNIKALALTVQKLLARLKFQREGQNDRMTDRAKTICSTIFDLGGIKIEFWYFVVWLKCCRYGVNSYTINHTIKTLIQCTHLNKSTPKLISLLDLIHSVFIVLKILYNTKPDKVDTIQSNVSSVESFRGGQCNFRGLSILNRFVGLLFRVLDGKGRGGGEGG